MSKFNVGDKVKVIGNCNHHHYSIGDVVTLVSSYRGYDDRFNAEREGVRWVVREQDIEAIESKFKIGQEVEIIKDTSCHGFEVGSVVTITQIKNGICMASRSGFNWYIVDSDMKEVVKTPKFKVGDKVVPISKTPKGYGGLENCGYWSKAKLSNNRFLYVTGTNTDYDGEEVYVCCDRLSSFMDGNFYLEADLIPYVEVKVEPKIEPKKVVNFKVGDKVKVIKNTCWHNFKIGEIITITKVNIDGVYANDKMGMRWFVRFDNIEAIEVVPSVQSTVKFDSSDPFVDFIMIGDITLAVPKGCKVGVAYKDPTDKYSETKGKAVALDRLIK